MAASLEMNLVVLAPVMRAMLVGAPFTFDEEFDPTAVDQQVSNLSERRRDIWTPMVLCIQLGVKKSDTSQSRGPWAGCLQPSLPTTVARRAQVGWLVGCLGLRFDGAELPYLNATSTLGCSFRAGCAARSRLMRSNVGMKIPRNQMVAA